ncbi:MAG: hypothetical protein V2J25_04435 [Desulfatiglans sp.]|nr:hypothetical protein [Thermodesulfobacteriota bacterium]MEE4352097.1 hypothetical protein [Desulfatiglans sp.]
MAANEELLPGDLRIHEYLGELPEYFIISLYRRENRGQGQNDGEEDRGERRSLLYPLIMGMISNICEGIF